MKLSFEEAVSKIKTFFTMISMLSIMLALVIVTGSFVLKQVQIGPFIFEQPEPTIDINSAISATQTAIARLIQSNTDTTIVPTLIAPSPTLPPTLTPTPTVPPTSTPTPTLTPTQTPTPTEIPNLLTNGDFSQDYEIGWKRIVWDEGGSGKSRIVPFMSTSNGRALRIDQENKGGIAFVQTVYLEKPLSDTDLFFSSTFQMGIDDNGSFGGEALGRGVCGIGIVYLDDNENTLAATRLIVIHDGYMNSGIFTGGYVNGVSDTNMLHNIFVEKERTYVDYSINLRTEVRDYLPSIKTEFIKVLKIMPFCRNETKDVVGYLLIGDIFLMER